MKVNPKKIALIAGSLVAGFIVNWLLWLIIMRHPSEIGLLYHALVTICLGAAILLVGDKVLNTEIFT